MANERASLQALSLLLGTAEYAWIEAERHSLQAFELHDRWTGMSLAGVLQTGTTGEGHAQDRLADRPLALLLTKNLNGHPLSFLPVLKALLILSQRRLQGETTLIRKIADGAGKIAANRLGWAALLPDRVDAPLMEHGLDAALQHCLNGADPKYKGSNSSLNAAQRAWLIDLVRWAELLRRQLQSDSGRSGLRPHQEKVQLGRDWRDEKAEDVRPPIFELLYHDEKVDEAGPERPPQGIAGTANLPAAVDLEAVDLQPAEAAEQSCWSSPANEYSEPWEDGEARCVRTGFRSAQENQELIWANRQLSPPDQRALVSALLAHLQGPESDQRDAAGLLALSHVTGQLLEQTLELGRTPSSERSYLSGGTLMRRVPTPRGAWSPTDKQRSLLRARTTHVPLDLPEIVVSWLARRWPEGSQGSLGRALAWTCSQAEEGVRKWLEALRKRDAGLQSLSRVEWWLPTALTRVGYGTCPPGDHVPPKLLCAVTDGLPAPAAYYRAYRADELNQLHRVALAEAGWTLQTRDSHVATPDRSTRLWVGSALNVEAQTLKTLWTHTFEHFSAVAGDGQRPLHERHNARETYECFSLMFQSFHRVVSDPFESLEYLDTERRLMVIDDKNQADTRAHRLVPLTACAANQCAEHVEHIRRLATEIKDLEPQTSRRLLDLVDEPESRASPFRFFLNEKLELVPVTPKQLGERLQGVWPLPLNAGRHLASTWLLERGVDDASLCAAAGHQDLGTQSLSLMSPIAAPELFERMRPLLDQWVTELGLKPIPSFLTNVRPARRTKRASKTSKPLVFGRELRAQVRANDSEVLHAEMLDRLATHFAERRLAGLVQSDVDALFRRLDESTSNERSHSTRVRREALREVILKAVAEHQILGIELPAVHLRVKDFEIICPLNCLLSHRWLAALRRGQLDARKRVQKEWRQGCCFERGQARIPLLLQLVTDCLVLDPFVWAQLVGQGGVFLLAFDESGQSALRIRISDRNSRLYPLPQTVAELLLREAPLVVSSQDLAAAAALANQWVGDDWRGAPVHSFDEFLARVRSAYSTVVPGLVLGYADGTHGAVSPEDICVERSAGEPPTLASIDAWRARQASPRTLSSNTGEGLESLAWAGELDRDGGADLVVELPVEPATAGGLKTTDKFRELMRQVIRSLDRHHLPSRSRREPTGESSAVTAEAPRTDRSSRQRAPLVRARETLAEHMSELAGSAELPTVCAMTVHWVAFLLSDGANKGQSYSPKTVHNYWTSWGIRVVELFGNGDPREMDADELEEIYLSIVEDMDEGRRAHVYPPMRNWHRYLVAAHGVNEIHWDEIWQACGGSAVNANLIQPVEYHRALTLLLHDEGMSERVRALQTASLILMYRFGLRIAEVHGLLSRDLRFDEPSGTWIAQVRRNEWRRLKSSNARRAVPCLEPLTAVEHEVLTSWQSHMYAYMDKGAPAPLFGQAETGADSRTLFPRHIVSQRIVQALRAATSDPSVRVHHCRHSYATRLLDQLVESTPGSDEIRTCLSGAGRVTVRSIWAMAAILGHGSPLTTLQVYTHAGHNWLRRWLELHVWPKQPFKEQFLDLAWVAGMQCKSAQKAAQRLGSDEAFVPAMQRLKSHQPPKSERASRQLTLPPRKLIPDQGELLAVDRLIDRSRRQVRMSELHLGLFHDEDWVLAVLKGALQFARQKRQKPVSAEDWWYETEDIRYSAHEQRQVDEALRVLQGMESGRRRLLLQDAAACIDPSGRMLVVGDPEQLKVCGELLSLLVSEASMIEVLVPDGLNQEASASPAAYEQVQQMISYARAEGFSLTPHKRVRAHGAQSHNRFKATVRVGLRLRESAVGRVRSAKVMTRVLVAAAVAERARAALTERTSPEPSVRPPDSAAL